MSIYPEKILGGFSEGTKARISAVRRSGEETRAFIREAVAREILRREKAAKVSGTAETRET